MFGPLMDQISLLHVACVLCLRQRGIASNVEQGLIAVQVILISLSGYLSDSNEIFQAMFIHPTNDYAFLLQMDTSMLPWYLHHIKVDADLLMKHGKHANKMQKWDNAKVFLILSLQGQFSGSPFLAFR